MNYDFNHAMAVFKHAVTNQYWDVDGRTNRRDFWHYASIAFIAMIIAGIPALNIFSLVLSLIIWLGLLGPSIGMMIRRVHDSGKEWWHGLIPFYNLYLATQEGETSANAYGDVPA